MTFHLSWPPWQPPAADGLAAIVAPGSSTAWADGLLARDGDGLVVWASTGAEAGAQALARLRYPGVRAVTLTPARSDPRRVRLGLEVALHLATIRSGRTTPPADSVNGTRPPASRAERSERSSGPDNRTGPGATGPADGIGYAPCLTSWFPPTPPPDVVRIPHLVTVLRDGVATDAVMWELTTPATAQLWLGGPLPDQGFFESRLDDLLRLRTAARRAQLPATAVSAGLSDLLRGRDLSIRLVYEHAVLFRSLLAG